MVGGALFVLDNLLALAVALALAVVGFGGREPWRPLFAAVALFPLVATGAMVLTALCFPLTPGATSGVLLALALPALWLLWRRRPSFAGALPEPGPAPEAASLVVLGLAGGLCAAWAFKTLVLGTEFEWDDLSYHAAVPAQWLVDRALSLVPFTYQTYYPMNSELFSLWFMLPFGRDAHANLAVFWWGLLAVASLALLARGLGGSWTAAGVAVSVFLSSYVVWNRSNSFGATDLACAATLLAALVFVGARPADALASGALAGFAVGCKIFYAPAAAVIGLALPRRRLPLFVLGLLATGSAWYLRNWLVTGNPVYPAEAWPFAGPFDAEARARTTLVRWLLAHPLDLSQWRHVIVTRLDWPPSLALLAALGYLGALRSRRGLLLAGVGLSLLVLYPFLPFSATKNRPDMELHVGYLRFALVPFAAGAVLFGLQLQRARPGFWLALALLAVAAAWKLPALPSLVAFLGAVALVGLPGRAARLLGAATASPARVLLADGSGLALLAAWTPAKQAATDANLHHWHARRAPIGQAWRALEALPAGSRVGFFMAEPQEYTQLYPIFGRRYQLRPVPVDDEGRPRRLLHEDGAPEGGWWADWDAQRTPLDPEAFRAHLRESGLDYVLVSRWSLGHWPRQRRALRSAGWDDVVYDDGYSELWRLRPPLAPPPDGSVVMITIDTLRSDHLSRNGGPRATTPYLDLLAQESVYCARSYAQASWTLPSMLSMFSSLSPPVFGVTEGVTPLPKPGQKRRGESEVTVEYFSDAYVTLPEVLAERGFVTAGVSTNGHLSRQQGFAQGFAHFDQTSCMWKSARCAFATADAWLDDYLALPREAPFFLWVHLFDPHFDVRPKDAKSGAPLYQPERGYGKLFSDGDEPDSLAERTRLDYDRKIRFVDDRLRDFVEALRKRGVLDRVLLVVAADHGEEFNEHGDGLWGHSKSVRNTLVHVPLLFRFPQTRPRGQVDTLVRNVDIAPTILDFLDIEAPGEMEGRSLLPLFRGETQAAPPAYGETRRFQRDLRYRIDPALDRKLVLDLASGERRLFSLSQDPGENTDLASREPERADAMERDLRAAIADMESRSAPMTRTGTLSDEEIESLRRLGYVR